LLSPLTAEVLQLVLVVDPLPGGQPVKLMEVPERLREMFDQPALSNAAASAAHDQARLSWARYPLQLLELRFAPDEGLSICSSLAHGPIVTTNRHTVDLS
jgi:hypothetical protein